MAITTHASGTTGQTSGGAETDIVSINAAGVYRLKLDLNLMAAGDVVYIRRYLIGKTGGTSRKAGFWGFYGAQDAEALIVDFGDDWNDLTDSDSVQYTIEQPFGTTRALPYGVMVDSGGGASAGDIADAVWDEDATAHQAQGTFGQAIGDPGADTNSIHKAVVTDASGATVGADATAIKAKTDSLTFTGANKVDASLRDWLGTAPNALQSGRVDSYLGAAADAVLTAAKFAAGAFDAVWSVAARILTAATNITSTGGTTVTQTGDSFARLGAPVGASVSADVAAVKADTAAVKAKTDNLPADPADASDIAGAFTTVNTKLDAIDDFVDTEVAAIKAKTDNLPSDPADQSLVIAATDAILARLGLPVGADLSADIQTRLASASITLTGGKVTPIDVDGLTHAKAMEVIIAAVSGVTVPSGSQVAFKKRDGTTTTLTITYGVSPERTASVVA
jgi:hypothetical protein